MSDIIGYLLPSALAVALSPMPIIAVVLVLGSSRARTSGPAFAAGWVAGLLTVTIVVVLIVGAGGESHGKDDGISWFKVAIGVLFLIMAAKQWKKRPKDGQQPDAPAWMATVDSAPPPKAAGLGALLSGANPKNLALTLAAAASVAGTGLDSAQKIAAIAVYVVLGSVTVVGPVIFYLLDAERAARPLNAIRKFMSDNNTVIMMVILLLLGAKLLGDGLAVV